MKEARAVILSKTGSRIVSPENTQLLVINTVAFRIYDKMLYYIVQEELWKGIGDY